MRSPDGKIRLATRQLSQDKVVLLQDTVNANNPFFSPNGQWIGFFADAKLKKIAVQGGAAMTLCDAPGPRGASWGDDDNIIMSLNGGTTGLVRVPSSGGVPTPVTQPDKEKRERTYVWPQVLPGGQAVLFTVISGSYEGGNINVLFFKSGQRKAVLRGGFSGRYLAMSNRTGYLVYIHQSTMLAD